MKTIVSARLIINMCTYHINELQTLCNEQNEKLIKTEMNKFFNPAKTREDAIKRLKQYTPLWLDLITVGMRNGYRWCHTSEIIDYKDLRTLARQSKNNQFTIDSDDAYMFRHFIQNGDDDE